MKRSSLPKDFKGTDDQFQKFVRAAKELECDPSEAAFEATVRKVVKAKPEKAKVMSKP